MDAPHRKIELQSPADLAYLTTLLRAAATKRLNDALPHSPAIPSDGPPSPDAYRAKVEALVEEFVINILNGLRRNVSINGQDVVPDVPDDGILEEKNGQSTVEVEEFEPYDEKLRAKVATMVQRRDALVGRISSLRRTAPKVAAEAHVKALQAEIEAQDKLWEEQENVASVVEQRSLVHVEIKRREEVEGNMERAVEGLGRLKDRLGETRARLERAGGVVQYLEEKKTNV